MALQERKHKFRDPIHGFIYVSDDEMRIIDSKPFQRLRNIKQLALTHYVFHGAEHTRFGHSMGVMQLATKAFRSAVSKKKYLFSQNETEHTATVEWLEQILRIIALTHDLGHAPFSHAAESLFPYKPKGEDGKDKGRYEHEDFTDLLILADEISGIIRDIGAEFVREYGVDYDITPQMICGIYRGKLTGKNAIFTFVKTFMDSELDCDKMDYLLRDSLYCGVSYGRYDVERLLASLTIFQKRGRDNPFLGIESGGIQAFEEFVLARYFMFVQVYFHRTRRFFDIQLVRAMQEILPGKTLPADMDEYLCWDDALVLHKLREYIQETKGATAAQMIVDRIPWHCVYSTKTHPEGDGLQLFQTVRRSLNNGLNKSIFNWHYLVDTSADKLPHKFIPQKHYIDDEETIAIVNRDGRITTISDESHIINHLTERINIQRIYVDEAYREKADQIVASLLHDTEEDDTDDE